MEPVVFILGPGHCGSTLLDLILGSHGRGFSIGEPGSLQNKMRGRELPERLCGVCEEECPLWDRPETRAFLGRYLRWAAGGSWARRLDARLGAARGDLYGHLFAATGAGFLVDSSKRPTWIRRQLAPRRFWRQREAWLIFMVRDGRAVVNSYLRKYPERGAAALAEGWVRTMTELEGFYQRFEEERRARVAYEALASDPEAEARRLCSWLGVDFEPEMLRFWRHPHHLMLGNAGTRSLIHRHREEEEGGDGFYRRGPGIRLDLRWRRELGAEALAAFERVAGETNRRYAYEARGEAAEG